MAGLLDNLNDPLVQGLLTAGFAGLAGYNRRTPMNSMGRAALAGLSGYSNAVNAQDAKALRDLQQQAYRLQLDQARQAAQDKKDEQASFDLLQKIKQSPVQVGTDTKYGFGGPGEMNMAGGTVTNTPIMGSDPKLVQQLQSNPYYQKLAGTSALTQMFAKPEIKEVDGNLVKINSDSTVVPLFSSGNKMTKADELRQRHLDRLAEIRASAQAAAANRPEKLVTVMDNMGNPVTMPQSQALEARMPIYNPTAAKRVQEEGQKAEARKQMSEAVGQLRSYYDDLNKNYGIPSTQNRFGSNILARAGASGIGQLAGGAVGTENQATRQKIEQTRPLLMNLIKQATGMSAQQMNSNAELSLYLKTATDPTLSYEANMQALDNLDRMFGLGLKGQQSSAPVQNDLAAAAAAELARRGKR